MRPSRLSETALWLTLTSIMIIVLTILVDAIVCLVRLSVGLSSYCIITALQDPFDRRGSPLAFGRESASRVAWRCR